MLHLNWLLVVLLLLIVKQTLQNQLVKFECENHTSCKFKFITENYEINQFFNGFYNGYYQYYNATTKSNVEIYFSRITKIKFEESHFESFPADLSGRLQALSNYDVSGVGLIQIKKDDFANTASLTTLNLSNNNLTSLGNMVFSNMKALTSLNLSRNQIESMHDGAFDECSTLLKTIDLSYNKILTIREDFFIDLQNSAEKYGQIMMLDFNEISTIEVTKKQEHIYFELLSLQNNQLSSFDCEKYIIIFLNLRNNNLDSFDDVKCDCESLLISGNHLKEITITKNLKNLDASNNEITTVKLDPNNNSTIESLNMSKNPNAKIDLDFVKKMKFLKKLDLSDILLGPLQIDAFSNMLSLEELTLKNTGISNIKFGTFSHQKNLTSLDISNNNLKSLNLHMFTGLYKLKSFHISGNNLSTVDNGEAMKASFPQLNEISIHDNNWNCSYLAILVHSFKDNKINVKMPKTPVSNSSHILGIGCTEDSNLKIDLLPENNNEMNAKLNELITKFN